MVEEAFSSLVGQDVTGALLNKQGYVASYNVAYDQSIYN